MGAACTRTADYAPSHGTVPKFVCASKTNYHPSESPRLSPPSRSASITYRSQKLLSVLGVWVGQLRAFGAVQVQRASRSQVI